MLMIFQTMAFQDSAYHWARDHRVHHKFSETDADPHNATRLGRTAAVDEFVEISLTNSVFSFLHFPEASSSRTLAGCFAANIRMSVKRAEVSICRICVLIQC